MTDRVARDTLQGKSFSNLRKASECNGETEC
jgi:hypothetical protein